MMDESTSSPLNITSPTPAVVEPEYFCKWVLYHEIPGSRVRMWDLCILVPNVLFLLFMALRFNRARLKLRATSSPIFYTFYILHTGPLATVEEVQALLKRVDGIRICSGGPSLLEFPLVEPETHQRTPP
ncbi:hypothetical protein HPB50_019998 [Hyalomma asiaticum]|uniref:Uncharacterized protein n=1 Tax=Hyalomma asiaticum TaxID=266040 RepID=A0ACB7RM29_HYAAI|nr:hypothetical protein HPB50_019998 [Hyalomma asiaticum]